MTKNLRSGAAATILAVTLGSVNASTVMALDSRDIGSVDQPLNQPFKIYMATDGYTSCDDVPDCGVVGIAPVKTLHLVHEILSEAGFGTAIWAETHNANVEVHIRPGTYYEESIDWTVTNPAYSITFMPENGGTTRPIFNGCSSTGTRCASTFFFHVKKSEPTNIHFRYIRIERYSNGIFFKGASESHPTSNSNNSVYGCYFYRIGNAHTAVILLPDGKFSNLPNGVGALNFNNSDYNTVQNTHFVNIENIGTSTSLHSIYMSHHSDFNYIARNRFAASNGIALKLRDGCWWNLIEHNTFTKDGPANSAGYVDAPSAGEQVSCQTVFRYNILDGKYDCTRLPVFRLYGTIDDYCVPAGYRLLSTAGNTDDGVECNGR